MEDSVRYQHWTNQRLNGEWIWVEFLVCIIFLYNTERTVITGIDTMVSLLDSLDSRFTYLIQLLKKTGFSVSKTPTTQETRYRIISLNIACITHGRYVIYYNSRSTPPYPAGYSTDGAYNELCEVEVWGCSTPGHYGMHCSYPCPQNCQDSHCNIVDGTCLGCVDGYMGQTCNEECMNNTYGLECRTTCGHCRNGQQCHHVSGSCPNGCDRGVNGVKCDKGCPNGNYGYNCLYKCSVNCEVPGICDKETGRCEGGCKSGWKIPNCDGCKH